MVIEKYRITAENIYNFDEKGFLMGMGRTMKRIVSQQALKSGRVTKSKQDGSREFISILACISAVGTWIPPLLIYKGESGDLMSTWVDEVNTDSQAHFTVSSNGWSNNIIGLMWLQKVFERYTKPKRENQKRLLIVDGHSSHVNMAFIEWADLHGIILLILPPHTTHRLQPLDVGLFQPLSTNYSLELDQLMNNGAGHVSMSKSFFFSMFKRAWDKAFTEDNIKTAFRRSGIWPTDGREILKSISRPSKSSPEKAIDALKTPKTAKSIRRLHVAYDRSPTVEKVKTLFATTLHLSAQISVLQHENRGLYKAIEFQKKKGRQGVRLNLCGQPNKNIIDCYSPAQVVKARRYQEQKEVLRATEEKAKDERRVQRAANVLKKAQEKEEREAKAVAKQLAKDLQNANASAKNASQTKAKIARSKAQKASSTTSKKLVTSAKAKARTKAKENTTVDVQPEVPVVLGVAVSNRTGRTIRLPQRFIQKN
jgi:hypothetical protein